MVIQQAEEKKEEAEAEAPEASPASDASGKELKADKWEQTLDSIKSQRPQAVAEGDVIRLSASTKNIPDGETVLFKVYNVAGTNASTLETIEAKVSGNRAEAQWTVAKDKKQDSSELEWDASYQGVESGRGKIEWAKETRKIQIVDNNDQPLSGAKYSIVKDGSVVSEGTLDDQGYCEIALYDDSSDINIIVSDG